MDNDKVYQKRWTSAKKWDKWIDLGAPPDGFATIATVSRNPSVCNIYAISGMDDQVALWQCAYYNGRWHNWQKHDDGITNIGLSLAAGSNGSDHEHVFVGVSRERNGLIDSIYQKWWIGEQGWSGWIDLGVPEMGAQQGLSTVSRNSSVCNIYAQGRDWALWQCAYYDGNWHTWKKHDDNLKLESARSMGPDHEHIFARHNDEIYQKWWTA